MAEGDEDVTKTPENVREEVSQPTVIYRGGWGAVLPRSQEPLKHPISDVLMTHTGGPECHTQEECTQAVKTMQHEHMVIHGFPDIKYNFLIGGDANLYEGSGWYSRATKDLENKELEANRLVIACVGDFTEKKPNEDSLKIAVHLIHHGVRNKYLTDKLNITPLGGTQPETSQW